MSLVKIVCEDVQWRIHLISAKNRRSLKERYIPLKFSTKDFETLNIFVINELRLFSTQNNVNRIIADLEELETGLINAWIEESKLTNNNENFNL